MRRYRKILWPDYITSIDDYYIRTNVCLRSNFTEQNPMEVYYMPVDFSGTTWYSTFCLALSFGVYIGVHYWWWFLSKMSLRESLLLIFFLFENIVLKKQKSTKIQNSSDLLLLSFPWLNGRRNVLSWMQWPPRRLSRFRLLENKLSKR